VNTLVRLIFAGFPLLRRAPMTVLVWGACLLPFSLLSTLLSGLYDGIEGVWGVGLPFAGRGWVQFGLLFANMLTMCAGMAVLAAAVFRAVADPERADGRWMRLSADEGRLTLVWSLMVMAGACVVFLIALVAVAVGGNTEAVFKPGSLIAFLTAAAILLARFMTAPSATVFEQRMSIADAWRTTRGRYGLSIVCALTFIGTYSGGEWLLSSLGDLAHRGSPEVKIGAGPLLVELARYGSSPEHLASDLARVVIGTVVGIIAYAPLAALYRDLTGRNPADQAAMFD
jgi:hypothetical protein